MSNYNESNMGHFLHNFNPEGIHFHDGILYFNVSETTSGRLSRDTLRSMVCPYPQCPNCISQEYERSEILIRNISTLSTDSFGVGLMEEISNYHSDYENNQTNHQNEVPEPTLDTGNGSLNSDESSLADISNISIQAEVERSISFFGSRPTVRRRLVHPLGPAYIIYNPDHDDFDDISSQGSNFRLTSLNELSSFNLLRRVRADQNDFEEPITTVRNDLEVIDRKQEVKRISEREAESRMFRSSGGVCFNFNRFK